MKYGEIYKTKMYVAIPKVGQLSSFIRNFCPLQQFHKYVGDRKKKNLIIESNNNSCFAYF